MSNIEITSNYYFQPWIMATSCVFLIFSIAFPLDGAFISITFTPMSGFLLSIFGLLQFFFFCFSKELFEFNPTEKKYRNGFKLFSFKKGEWKEFSMQTASRFAFQKYEETVEYNFGGIFNPRANSDIFELRLIKKDDTFEPIVNGSNIKDIAKIVKLGNLLSQIYGIPFYDYVRDFITKRNVE